VEKSKADQLNQK